MFWSKTETSQFKFSLPRLSQCQKPTSLLYLIKGAETVCLQVPFFQLGAKILPPRNRTQHPVITTTSIHTSKGHIRLVLQHQHYCSVQFWHYTVLPAQVLPIRIMGVEGKRTISLLFSLTGKRPFSGAWYALSSFLTALLFWVGSRWGLADGWRYQ